MGVVVARRRCAGRSRFLLESAGDEVAALVREFVARYLPTA
ncbi:hypothetical protein ACQPZQ_31025 [Pseudonocardia sp. CA-142604]